MASPSGQRRRFSSIGQVTEAEKSNFFDSVKCSNWAKVATLLHRQPSLIKSTTDENRAALHQAAHKGDKDAVELFLELGGDAKLRDADQNTPADVAAKRFEELGHEVITRETIADHEMYGAWASTRAERQQQLESLQEVLNEMPPMVDRVEAIAHSYMTQMNCGVLGEDGIQELRQLWQLLDPGMSLLREVTEKITAKLIEKEQEFFKLFGLETAARYVCWKYWVDPEDVQHALNELNVPDDTNQSREDRPWAVLPSVFGRFGFHVLVSDIVAGLMPLWDGENVRAGFQLMGLKRWCKKHRSSSNVERVRILARSNTMANHLKADGGFMTLYLTIMACKIASFLEIGLLWTFLETVMIVTRASDVSQWVAIKLGKLVGYGMVWLSSFQTLATVMAWLSDFLCPSWPIVSCIWCFLRLDAWFWLLFVFLRSFVIGSYAECMKPRIPMLTVQLHRYMLLRGQLKDQDYKAWNPDFTYDPSTDPQSSEYSPSSSQ